MKLATSNISVIIPMKPLHSGKSRLDEVMELPLRAALSLFLFRHVLETSLSSEFTAQHSVVGGDRWIQHLTENSSSRWYPDNAGELNHAIDLSIKRVFLDGANAALILPGDLGFLTTDDISSMVLASQDLKKPVLAPAFRDGGTNALLIPRDTAFVPLFGLNSFKQHLEAMSANGTPGEIVKRQGLGFDLDTPEDLATYHARNPGLMESLASLIEEVSITKTHQSVPHNRSTHG